MQVRRLTAQMGSRHARSSSLLELPTVPMHAS